MDSGEQNKLKRDNYQLRMEELLARSDEAISRLREKMLDLENSLSEVQLLRHLESNSLPPKDPPEKK